MIDSLASLSAALNNIYPTRYSHFVNAQPMPFITYITDDEDGFYADNENYVGVTNIIIELYTASKDLVAENAIKSMLKGNKIPYTFSGSTYIDTENAFLHTFEIALKIKGENI